MKKATLKKMAGRWVAYDGSKCLDWNKHLWMLEKSLAKMGYKAEKEIK